MTENVWSAVNLDHGGRPVVQGVQGLAVSTETLNKASIGTEYR
jgi:hypothetical protein